MTNLNKHAKIALCLFVISLVIAIAAFAGGVYLAFAKAYAAGIVLGAVSIIAFYSAPIYYNNAALSKASFKILAAINDGAKSLDEVSHKTGIRKDACEKLYNKAVARGIIKGFEAFDVK